MQTMHKWVYRINETHASHYDHRPVTTYIYGKGCPSFNKLYLSFHENKKESKKKPFPMNSGQIASIFAICAIKQSIASFLFSLVFFFLFLSCRCLYLKLKWKILLPYMIIMNTYNRNDIAYFDVIENNLQFT